MSAPAGEAPDATSRTSPTGLRRWGGWLFEALGSYTLCIVILLFLLLLTYLGTLAQQFDNLYNVQVRYFESMFIVERVRGFPVPLPGAYLLLSLLFVNLLVGGMIRLRKTRSRAGILIIHIGMALLLLGGLVEYHFSDKGYMALHEEEAYADKNENGRWDAGEPFDDADGSGTWTPGEVSQTFTDHFLWDVTVSEVLDKRQRMYVLPYEPLSGLGTSTRLRFTHDDLPFDLSCHGWSANARVETVAPDAGYGVDGLALKALPEHPEKKEANLPGVYVTLAPKDGGAPTVQIAWGGERQARRHEVGGRTFDVRMAKRQYPLPFKLRVNKFIKREHPGTSMAAEYSSRVTKIENDVPEDRHITMNEPLRHHGVTLYQSEYGQQRLPTGRSRYYSQLAVVRNPADQWPLYACLIILVGMLWHFGRKLSLHIQTERRRASA